MVQFAWNSFQNPEDMAGDIVLNVVDDAVNAASLRDPGFSNDEVSETVGDAIREIMSRNEPVDGIMQALAPLNVEGVLPGSGVLEDSSGLTDYDDAIDLFRYDVALSPDGADNEEAPGVREGDLLGVDDANETSAETAEASIEQKDKADKSGKKVVISSLNFL